MWQGLKLIEKELFNMYMHGEIYLIIECYKHNDRILNIGKHAFRTLEAAEHEVYLLNNNSKEKSSYYKIKEVNFY